MRTPLLVLLSAGLVCAAPVPRAATGPLPTGVPEKEGMSAARLERMHTAISKLVTEGQRAGAITMVVRNGVIVDWKNWGYRDLQAKLPMEKDTICRIYSMSKIISTVAVMQLFEEGRFELDDPVERYIPELKGMRVFEGGTAEDPFLAPARRPITIKHLLTHTSGLTYGGDSTPVERLWARARFWEAPTLKEFVGRVAALPLVHHPGEAYNYGVSIDILGYLVEVVSGMPFDRFVEQRILKPLALDDTYYFVPEEKKARLAKIYIMKDGKLAESPATDRTFPAGGGGMWSTIGDYARFAQMLCNHGQLQGTRILSRKTVELMMTNHLNHLAKPTIGDDGAEGFGLGGSVVVDLAKSGSLGTVGQFGWGGAASTLVRIDPKEKLVLLLFMQYVPYDTPTLSKFGNLVYQAITD